MNPYEKIGERLKEERKKLGLSQKNAGAAVGVSHVMWGKYERGSIPGRDVANKLQSAGFDTGYIFTGVRADAHAAYAGAMEAYQSTHEILVALWKLLGLSDDLFDAMLWAHREKNPNWEGFLHAALSMQGIPLPLKN